MKYYGTRDRPGSHFPFNFLMINGVTAESNATKVYDAISNWYNHMPEGAWANWVVSILQK